MTARRGLKKIVRGRMGCTGESYSTALRHVAGAPTAGPTAGPRHRESALVGYLLESAGLSLREPMVCGLGGGIGFLYAVFEYDAVPHPLLTIVAQHHPQPWAEAVLGRLDVPYEEGHSGSPRTAGAKLAAVLGSGRPALCTVDRGRLPWRTASTPMEAADPHTVAVVGRSGVDLSVLDPPFGERSIDADAFLDAWAAHRKGRFSLVSVAEAPSTVDLEPAVRDAVATTVAHLTGPVLGNAFDVNLGFSGMAKLSAELRDRRTRKGWVRRFAAPVACSHAMSRLVECLEREYTAPGATRPIYAEFLDAVAPEAAGPVRDSGRAWSQLARWAAAGPPDGDLAAWCDRAADLVDESLAAEREAVARLGQTGL